MGNIENKLKEVDEIRKRIREMLGRIKFPGKEKIILLAAYTDIALEHNKAICLLIKKEVSGSAFALVRPLFETFIRAYWVCACATDSEIIEICNKDKDKFPIMNEMVKSCDQEYSSNNNFQKIKNEVWSPMSSYTHSGLLQISRRFTGCKIKPNYKKDEKLEVLNFSIMIVLLIACLFFKETKQMVEAQETERLITSF